MHGIIVQLTVEGGQCSEIVNRCQGIRCADICNVLHGKSGLGSFCDEFDACTCLFNQDPSSTNVCIIGAGACGNCDLACCNARCGHQFNGVGACVPNPGTVDRCVCAYKS